MIPGYIIAGLWGAIGSFAILIGAFFGCRYNIPKRVIAIITAFSSGILISAVCFELLFEAYSYGDLYPTVVGFVLGVILFTLIDAIIHRFSLERYKADNISEDNVSDDDIENSYDDNTVKVSSYNDNTAKVSNYNIHHHRYSNYFNKYQVQGLTTVVGALLDGIPEAIAIGLTFFIGGPISVSLLIAVIIANSFEGATASLYMRLGGWSVKSILETWILVIILTIIAAISSYIIFSHTDQHILAGALAMASGALLAMIADTMLPEAYDEMQEWTGFIMCMGFLLSFVLSHIAMH